MTMNYLAIFVCAIAAMVVGFVWYGPLFGRAWMEIMGANSMTPEEKEKMKKSMGVMYFTQFVLSLVTAGALDYHITHWTGDLSPLGIALCVWFGFVLTTTAGASLWSGKSPKVAWKMFFISAGAQLVTFAVFGIILGMWR